MLRMPRAGRVKTRLGREIGMTVAAWWFRHQSRRLLRRLDDPRWRLTLAITPDRDTAAHGWPALPRLPQGPGHLGTRMTRIFRTLPPGPAIIIGADIPAITPAHIARAFAALGCAEVVLGPAADGGYWLIGMRRLSRPPPGLLDGVRWSSPHALADTITALGCRRIAFADRLHDIDTAADLDTYRRHNRMV
jgi:rSAM/selenodomain-associated transferase 1